MSAVELRDLLDGPLSKRGTQSISYLPLDFSMQAAKELAAVSVEKEKLQYQIVHLKRSLEEADKKLVQKPLASK